MPGHTGYASGWDKTDLTDIRTCFKCRRKMRHRHAKEELFPDTVAHRSGGYCSGCHPAATKVYKAKTPEEEARRVEDGRKVAAAIRARRERLGIGPDGRPGVRRIQR